MAASTKVASLAVAPVVVAAPVIHLDGVPTALASFVLTPSGHPEEAIELSKKAIALSPYIPPNTVLKAEDTAQVLVLDKLATGSVNAMADSLMISIGALERR